MDRRTSVTAPTMERTVTPLQQHLGVTVIDASDPRHPRVSTYLDDPAVLAPHETLKTNERSKLLAGAEKQRAEFCRL